MFCGFAELQGVSGVKPPELQDAVCSKAMALCSIVTRYGAAPVPDGKPATIDAFLTRLIRQASPPFWGLCHFQTLCSRSRCCCCVAAVHCLSQRASQRMSPP